MQAEQHTSETQRGLRLALGAVAAGAAAGAALASDLPPAACWTAAITGLCATWWVLEPIPIPATSLIPFAAFPLAGVVDHARIAQAYGHTLVLLLLGGFMLSKAVEKSRLHRRLALGMVRVCGGGGRRLVLGFMFASWVCSMWISNTATTLMLLPVALAVLESREAKPTAVPLLLGLAYAASIGGMATPIGTPPNVIFMAVYEQATGETVHFLEWMTIGLPAAALLLPIAWLWVTRSLGGTPAPTIPHLGPWRAPEARVLVVFGLTAAAWIFRTEPFGGWSGLFGVGTASDSTVAMAAVVVLFLLPDGEGGQLLDWKTARTIPWGLLILFGGGIAISTAFEASGLSSTLGEALGGVATWPLVAVILILCLAVTFMTEVTSNTATTNLLMPVLASAAIGAGLAPERLMLPAALSASCAFMLPVATAPNAIVAGSGYVHTADMAREGAVLNVLGAMTLTAVCSLLL
ncbi:SLC13 family permease [Nitrococcus mobilis]|uniref:Probable transporter n=1 Tax=Nitrococcus mobilis Nb-231 TaxID=314278 RepID=A4BV86_9GAMM|nr:SLC13 family permease [Nitrococcus mobilis]EAR20353.1 probable transporter [Nitrococcus mobilis Nb-231]